MFKCGSLWWLNKNPFFCVFATVWPSLEILMSFWFWLLLKHVTWNITADEGRLVRDTWNNGQWNGGKKHGNPSYIRISTYMYIYTYICAYIYAGEIIISLKFYGKLQNYIIPFLRMSTSTYKSETEKQKYYVCTYI